MKKVLFKNWLSVLAVVLSIVAIYLSLRTPIEVEFDSALLVSVATLISVPTAILIGFQIYNALDIQKQMQDVKNGLQFEYEKINKHMDDFEEESNKKIDTLKSERGLLKLSHSNIQLSKDKGTAYFTIDSNTKWNIFVNNTANGQSVNNLNVFPVNGEGNATITIEYGSVETENFQQSASITVFYMSYGTKQNETLSIYRKHLPF